MKKLLLLVGLAITSQTFAQFSQSFEGGTTTPAGWTVINGGDANTWQIQSLATSNALQAQNGTNMYSISYGSTAHNDYLVTPQFTVTAGVTDKLTFWGRSRDPFYPETISIKVSTSTATAAAFTTNLVPLIAPQSGSNFYKFTVDLANFAGQAIYIGFHSETTDKFAFDIDNVVLGSTVSCLEPTSPLTLAPSSTSVTVSWDASSAASSGYDIYHSTSGVAPTSSATPSQTVDAGFTDATIQGLTPGTKYYFYVRSKCSSTVSSVWGHLGMTSTAVVAPYTYGFDNTLSYTADFWTGTWSTNATTGNPQAGAQMVFSNNATTATNRWLFSRPIALQANSVNTITFYVRLFGGALPQSLRLTAATTNIAADHTNVIYNSTTLVNTAWTQVTATFTPTTTGTYYFGFQHYSPAQATTVSLGLDTFAISSVLSTEDFNAKKLSVYPNPVKDIVNISNDANYSLQSVNITDLNGRTVKSIKLNGEASAQVNISDLSSGIYMMNISSDQGSIIKKIVKN